MITQNFAADDLPNSSRVDLKLSFVEDDAQHYESGSQHEEDDTTDVVDETMSTVLLCHTEARDLSHAIRDEDKLVYYDFNNTTVEEIKGYRRADLATGELGDSAILSLAAH
ncbi:unnamed protein product [Nippostrongylus brasiliensis]|uniref:HalOD1 domain-containing protein n=1 Tax=Nippostrongylus brasiliensis TaxID=27835 RepID=A0A0N4YCR4_NIPBR|nr:unnamed protein product [Nippostrongylus brasiliensis]